MNSTERDHLQWRNAGARGKAIVAAEAGDTGRNLLDAADHNLRITLEAIRRGGALARSELARVTGLSGPGVGNILRQLTAAGLIEAKRRTGRTSSFGLVGEARFGLGIDVGSDGATAVLIDLGGRAHMRRRLEIADSMEVESLTRTVAAYLGPHPDRLIGCGISLGEGFARADLGSIESALAPLRTCVANDTAAASLGELHLGTPEDGSFVYLLLDRTIRAGLVINGKLFEGVRGRAGLLGSMRVDGGGGTLDAVAGTGTMPGFPFPENERQVLPGPAIDDWLGRAVPHLMDAVVAVSGFLAPSSVFVGGRLPKVLLTVIADRMARERSRRMRHPTQPNWLPRIVPGSLARDSAAMGAAILPFFDRLLPDPRR